MFTSFSTALSALSAHATAVDVVGNNLANLSTTGYKTSVVSFHDLVTQSLGAGLGETQVGFGTARPFTIRQFTQGAVQRSSVLLDAAVQGDGFFVLRGSANGVLFTRAGSFQVDRDGNLLTGSKERVQGWPQVNGVLNTSGPIGDIVVPVGQLRQPMATRNVSIDANLNAAARAGATSGAWSTPIEIVDSLGKPLVLTLTFTKDATTPNQWNYDVTVPGEALASGPPGVPQSVLASPGSVVFNSSGKMETPALASGTVALNITVPGRHATAVTGVHLRLAVDRAQVGVGHRIVGVIDGRIGQRDVDRARRRTLGGRQVVDEGPDREAGGEGG